MTSVNELVQSVKNLDFKIEGILEKISYERFKVFIKNLSWPKFMSFIRLIDI